MNEKKINPAAINALKEALTNIYWFKSDLRSFITNTITNAQILSSINWDDYKRNIVSKLVETLIKNQATLLNDLLKLIYEIIRIDDFSHLEHLEDGKNKAVKAKKSVEALRKLSLKHFNLEEEQDKAERNRKKTFEKIIKYKEIKEGIEKIKNNFFELLKSDNPQDRGFKLEKIIRELFELFDLDPKASFKIQGEQIDGSFTFDKTDYLLEAKWQTNPVGIKELDAFSGKLTRRLENTLGLFLSINGFSEDAVKAHSTGRRLMILMDGSDLMAVLESRIDLMQLLLRKRRHASQTGNIYLKIHEILI